MKNNIKCDSVYKYCDSLSDNSHSYELTAQSPGSTPVNRSSGDSSLYTHLFVYVAVLEFLQ